MLTLPRAVGRLWRHPDRGKVNIADVMRTFLNFLPVKFLFYLLGVIL